MADRLILVRHGETGARGFIGRTDVPLSAEGRAQAERIRLPAGRVYVSPLRRAVETAELAGLAPELLPDLREIDFGDFEGRTFEEVSAERPELLPAWAEYDPSFAFPGGESVGDFLARVERVGERLASDPSETVIAVTHGGVIRSLICRYLGLPPKHYLLFDVKPGCAATIRLFGDRGVLAGLEEQWGG
ncbi:MAG: histidine phosphatase family protein [Armatimonadota bacterium]